MLYREIGRIEDKGFSGRMTRGLSLSSLVRHVRTVPDDGRASDRVTRKNVASSRVAVTGATS